MAPADSRTRRVQQYLCMGIALACWVLLSVAYLGGLFRPFDLRFLDWRFRLRGERQASDSIAILGIDDATIRGYGGSWPLPRDSYALLVTALEEAGARSIGFDIQFPSNRALDPKSDELLAYVSSAYPNIVHAVSFHPDQADSLPDSATSGEVLKALRRHGGVAEGVPAPHVGSVSLPYRDLVLQAKALGHVMVPADQDGAIRRQPLLIRYEERLYPALALRMVGVAKGLSAPPEIETGREGARVGWPGVWWPLRLDEEGATGIDFAGDRAAFPNSHSMLDVLQRYRGGDRKSLREAFSNRNVLIGLDSRQEVTEDVGTTPFAAATPLLFVHANMLDNLLRGRFLRHAPVGPYLGALAILAVFLGWIFSSRSIPASALVAALALTAIAGLDFALFAGWAIDAPPMAALALAPLIYASTGTFRYIFLERRDRQREEDLRDGRTLQMRLRPEALIGEKLSHYQIMEKLGMGGMGVVYLARDEHVGRSVALKVLPGRALEDEPSRRRFRREARALSKLNHPHIAAIFEYDSQDGTDFIVMEFVAGMPLSQRIKRGPLLESEILHIGVQVLDALRHAHGHGIIHRDLKPQNVILTASGDAKVLDFGLARFFRSADGSTASQSLTETGQVVGTLPYMPPESFQGVRSDERSDLYSVGVVLFEMATGRRPFSETEPHELIHSILNQPPASPRVLNGKISVLVEEVVLRALEKDPDLRFSSATEMLEALTASRSEPATATSVRRDGR
jgi:CHASE2 domain-containing sensor protein/predicted Ser/Thr protein kinase